MAGEVPVRRGEMSVGDLAEWYMENVILGPWTYTYRVADWLEARWGMGAAVLAILLMLPLFAIGMVFVMFVAIPVAVIAAVPLSIYDIAKTARRKHRA